MLFPGPALLAFVLQLPPPVELKIVQVAPAAATDAMPRRSEGQFRAVVLLHGFRPHPIRDSGARQPELSFWEAEKTTLVKTLSRDADVFSVGYTQNVPVDEVALAPQFYGFFQQLRASGYRDVVLIGYSAGGLIARYYVENTTGGGVNKVIQVCAPNGGTAWGKLTFSVRRSQEPFLTSLTPGARQKIQAARTRRIPAEIEFACLVSKIGPISDGLVRIDSQWSQDLQEQGIPAYLLKGNHVTAMWSKTVVQKLVEVIRDPQPRWSPTQVAEARIKILGQDPRMPTLQPPEPIDP